MGLIEGKQYHWPFFQWYIWPEKQEWNPSNKASEEQSRQCQEIHTSLSLFEGKRMRFWHPQKPKDQRWLQSGNEEWRNISICSVQKTNPLIFQKKQTKHSQRFLPDDYMQHFSLQSTLSLKGTFLKCWKATTSCYPKNNDVHAIVSRRSNVNKIQQIVMLVVVLTWRLLSFGHL